MFYTFYQNNSGGRFREPAHYVIIEAKNYHQANDRAENVGLYFDGCESGSDCPCCGDRWYELYDETDGHDSPQIYGQSPDDYLNDPKTMKWDYDKGVPAVKVFTNEDFE